MIGEEAEEVSEGQSGGGTSEEVAELEETPDPPVDSRGTSD